MYKVEYIYIDIFTLLMSNNFWFRLRILYSSPIFRYSAKTNWQKAIRMEGALSDSVQSSAGAARAEVSRVVSHLWNRILVLIFPCSRFCSLFSTIPFHVTQFREKLFHSWQFQLLSRSFLFSFILPPLN